MSYNIGLKTDSEKQAEELYKFTKNKLLTVDILHPKMFNIQWLCGKDMSYINNPNYFGISYSTLEGFKSIYFFSVIYHLAIKFNLYQEINNQKVVVLNYDDDELYYLSYSNPFNQNDDRYLSFVKINEDGLKDYTRKGWCKIFGNKISEEEIKFVKDNIEIINKANL